MNRIKTNVATLLLVTGMVAGLAWLNWAFVPSRAAAEQKKEKVATEKKLDAVHSANAAKQDIGIQDPAKPVGDGRPEEAPAVFKVKMDTTKGEVLVEVHKDWAPLGAQRFYELVRRGFFTDIRIFRMVPGFVAQFGISGNPNVAGVWLDRNIQDDPVKETNSKGTITFAMGGPNTRTTQIFINLADNGKLDSMGFAPFAKITQGMQAVESWNSKYTEQPTKMQENMQMQGNAFLDQAFPGLDSIKSATIVE